MSHRFSTIMRIGQFLLIQISQQQRQAQKLAYYSILKFINQIAMLEYFIASSVILFAYLAYILFIRPLKIKAYYSKVFKQRGYKVYEYPYQILTAPFYRDLTDSFRQKGDLFHIARTVYNQSYDLILSNILNQPQVVFLNPQLIKEIHRTDVVQKIKKKSSAYEIFDFIINKGLVFVEKNVWRHRRKLINKVFNYDFVISQIPFMVKHINQTFQKMERENWQKDPSRKQSNQIQTSLYEIMTQFTSSIVIASFLGIDSLTEQLRGKPIQLQILRLSEMSVDASRDPLIILFGRKILQMGVKKSFREVTELNNEVNAVLQVYINKYRQNLKNNQNKNHKKGIIELILQDMDKRGNNQEVTMTDADLIDQIKTFMIAGTDTTSNYLTMALLNIYENKYVLERLRNEIEQYIKCDQDITYQNIKKIEYLDQVLLEGSRTYPAASSMFQRQIVQDLEIDKVIYAKGMSLCTLNIPFIYNPQIFQNPTKFKPERWQADSQENKRLSQFVSYQFSGGPRGCIGKHLALTETKVMLVKFLMRYQNLVEPGRNNRVMKNGLVQQLVNSDVILTKYP